MGWTTTSDYDRTAKGLFTIREYLDQEFASDNPEYPRYEILDSSMTGRTEYYAAARRTDRKTGEARVFAMVVMVRYEKRAYDGHTLGWKDMSEYMDPHLYNCPERILRQLDDTDDEYALAWRKKCRVARAAKRKARTTFDTGSVVRFDEPLRFNSGVERQRFTVERDGRKLRFRAEDGVLCRIPKAAGMTFEIVSTGD